MKDLFKRFKAYTLTEIVIVMLIIAVIVAVSLKITKAHMDSVVKYTYYSAYDLLSSVTGEMITDSDLSEQYGNYKSELPIRSLSKSLISKMQSFIELPAFASNEVQCSISSASHSVYDPCSKLFCSGNLKKVYAACSYNTHYLCAHCEESSPTTPDTDWGGSGHGHGDSGSSSTCSNWISAPYDGGCPLGYSVYSYSYMGKYQVSCRRCETDKLPEDCLVQGKYWSNGVCISCPSHIHTNYVPNESGTGCVACETASSCALQGKLVENCSCVSCPDGKVFDTSTKSCVTAQACGDGEIWDADMNSCRVPQTADDCTPTQVFDKDKQMCREKNITLPQDGNAFCDAFVSLTNTNKFNCSGKNTAQIKEVLASGDFSNLEPDIVLRNGMRLYNVKNPAVAIKKLEGNTSIAMQTPEIYSDSLIRSLVASIHTLSDKLVVFLQNLTQPKAYATSMMPNETQEACACWADTYPNCRPASQTCPSQGSPCHVTQCNSDQYYDYNVCACVGGSASTDPDDSTTACAAPTCDEGYELDTSKGECGECVAVTDTDDKDSSEVTIPTLDGLNEKGYIVYVDIDGERGDSILYEDVYPFYITFSGLVIPGYEKGQESGGNSKGHLSVSVKYDTYGSSRKVNWMNPKSTDFRHAACMSKYVTATNYCTGVVDNDLSSKQSICSNKESDCRIVPNKPLKF